MWSARNIQEGKRHLAAVATRGAGRTAQQWVLCFHGLGAVPDDGAPSPIRQGKHERLPLPCSTRPALVALEPSITIRLPP